MSVIAVVGAQWGDEGKGRVVDYLAHEADLVIRYGGGNNAGHTVVNPHGHFKLHLIPSGIFHPGTRNLLGNGVVINPPALVAELDGLAAAGFDCANLFISDRAHLVMPYHVLLDQLEERERGAPKLGTTSRGIGPAYVDKVARRGIRVVDLMEPDAFRARLADTLPRIRRIVDGYAARRRAGRRDRGGDRRGPHHRRLPRRRRTAHAPRGRRPGHGRRRARARRAHPARGAARHDARPRLGHLPVRHQLVADPRRGEPRRRPAGGGHRQGARRGEGVHDRGRWRSAADGARWARTASASASAAHEYGTSTGRARRCGWYDAVAVRFSVRLAGYSSIALTKLDVLDGFDRIPIAAAYRDPADGREWTTVPASTSVYERLEPVYEELDGWGTDTTGCRAWAELPPAARAYVERLEQLAGVPISHVSVGPERAQMIVR